jgi:general secretion pathway protein M
MEQIKIWYRGLQPRERLVVMSASAVVGVFLLIAILFGPLASSLRTRQERVANKQQDLIWMRSVSNSVRMMAAAQPAGTSAEPLVVLINRTAQQAGITGALTNQAPQGDNGIRIRLEGASFDAMVAWLGVLEQQYGVRVDNASMDRGDKIGVVNASLTLARGAHT